MPIDIYIVVGDRWQEWRMVTSDFTFLCAIVWRVLFIYQVVKEETQGLLLEVNHES
jgi:hypothetical protein